MIKTILVTGADGFKGSHITEMLLDKNYKVKALSQYNSFNYWGWLNDFLANKNLEIISGDSTTPFYKEITKSAHTELQEYEAAKIYLSNNAIDNRG